MVGFKKRCACVIADTFTAGSLVSIWWLLEAESAVVRGTYNGASLGTLQTLSAVTALIGLASVKLKMKVKQEG